MDAVNSVGWIENPLRLPYTANNPSIRIGRRAVSIDERRAFFPTNHWRPAKPPKPSSHLDLQQVCFGVHKDVGGGYPEQEGGLSKTALEWMAGEAHDAGLLIDQGRFGVVTGLTGGDRVPASSEASRHESLTGQWRLAEVVPKKLAGPDAGWFGRRPDLFRRRALPPAPLVHDAAFLRRGYPLSAGAVRARSTSMP